MVDLVEFIELIEVHYSVGHVEVIELSGKAAVKEVIGQVQANLLLALAQANEPLG